jgi:hypothetical protein
MPLNFYLKLADYSGGYRYLKWFEKNFPDDGCYPDFLFEVMVILFKCNHLEAAGQKAREVFYSNGYLLDHFLGKGIVPLDKYENGFSESPAYCQIFSYSGDQVELFDLIEWLLQLLETQKFRKFSAEIIDIWQALKLENDVRKRSFLNRKASKIVRSL